MRAKSSLLAVVALSATLLFSCERKTEEFETEAIADYLPLQTGKYITYRLDSTVFPNFGRNTEVHSYQEKHIVDAQIPDAMGRPSYRILRFTRDTLGTGPWSSAGTYFITPMRNTAEVIENNLRFLKLALPLHQDVSWKGNRYLGDEPYSAQYSFQNDNDMSDWDYTISKTGETIVLNGQSIPNVITVLGKDQHSNVPVTDAASYGYIDYNMDRYAKGIGLVYQQQIMWDYQPPNGTLTTGFKTGFGIKRSMIDHN